MNEGVGVVPSAFCLSLSLRVPIGAGSVEGSLYSTTSEPLTSLYATVELISILQADSLYLVHPFRLLRYTNEHRVLNCVR